jgi:hypothetical protein
MDKLSRSPNSPNVVVVALKVVALETKEENL